MPRTCRCFLQRRVLLILHHFERSSIRFSWFPPRPIWITIYSAKDFLRWFCPTLGKRGTIASVSDVTRRTLLDGEGVQMESKLSVILVVWNFCERKNWRKKLPLLLLREKDLMFHFILRIYLKFHQLQKFKMFLSFIYKTFSKTKCLKLSRIDLYEYFTWIWFLIIYFFERKYLLSIF